MGTIISINISDTRGIDKTSKEKVEVVEGWGLEGDAHGGDWDRQVSIFPVEALSKVPPEKMEEVSKGGYTENFTISGIEPSGLAVGNLVVLGEAVIEILHIGKDVFKEHGRPYIVSREGRFGRVAKGGAAKVGDTVAVYTNSEESFLECAKAGNTPLVKLFLAGNINPDARDIYGATALMLAAKSGCRDMVRVLLDKGADVNAASDDGITALMAAILAVHNDIAEMLLNKGADPGARSKSGITALMLARQGNNNAVLQLLEKNDVV
jgi:MOSC domain-containing protein YiiM